MALPVSVLKFGGSSLARPEQITAVARKLAELHRAGRRLIVVVSAMGKTTDELTRLARQVSAVPDRRELDMLLSTGERVTMALLSMSLKDLKIPSISFTGSQAGLFTDGSHSNAKLIDIRPIRVDDALKTNKVVVLAGFQGVDPITKEITTLGRGGSDTTAVAMAAHFNAECTVLKDVDGIYSADPKIIPDAVSYAKFPLDCLHQMCFWGAKVLHGRSVELALRRKVPLGVGRSETFKVGTQIYPMESGEFTMFENQQVLAVNSHGDIHHLHIASTDTSEALTTFKNILNENNLAWPQILATSHENGTTRIMYTGDEETLSAIRFVVENSSKIKLHKKALSSVTVTCFGSVGTDLIETMAARLKSAGIEVEKTIVTSLSVSFFIPSELREKALAELHTFVKKGG